VTGGGLEVTDRFLITFILSTYLIFMLIVGVNDL